MKKFLTAFSALAATFGASAGLTDRAVSTDTAPISGRDLEVQVPSREAGAVSIKDAEGKLFEFILKRDGASGELMAMHQSHSSHSSHSSHASHYSSRY